MSTPHPDRPVPHQLDDQSGVVDLVGRLAAAVPPFPFTVGPAGDGVESVLVAAEHEAAAREHFAAHPLRVDGERALPVALDPGHRG